jgi:chromosome segregation ATPase
MESTQTAGEGLTFEKVWATIQENGRQIGELRKTLREMGKETDRQMQETDRLVKENARRMKETDRQMKETDRRMKETDRQIGKLGNRFGEMIEHMVMPNLLRKFRRLGFTFMTARRAEIKGQRKNVYAEVDAFLENGKKVMAVEVKAKPDINDINEHVKRMEKLRRYADSHHDRRAYLGAIAGMVFGEDEKNYALKEGFYVIEPSGDTFNIVIPKGRPREW